MTPDGELLRKYAEEGSDPAFAELVGRHVDLVYSVALRQAAGEAPLAQDVTQLVFLDLARKARMLSDRPTLAGWLHTSARFAASKAIRGEHRRRVREQEALAMNENPAVAEIDWEQLRPLLDESVGQLNEADRDAIVLRFFEGKNHQEIGAIFGLSENSANKRIERALEKLRGYFASRGVTTTSAILATTITANSVQAAPAGLAEKVAPVSLAGAGVVTEGILLKILFMSTKIKLLAAAIILVAAVALTLNWPQPTGQTVAPLPAIVAPPAQVGKPSLSAAVPANGTVTTLPAAPAPVNQTAAVTQYVAGPQTDLKMAIETGLHFLESQDTLSFLKTLMPPDALPREGKGATLEDMIAQISQDPNTLKKLAQMMEALNALGDKTPALNAEGTRATYNFNPPVGGHKAIIFNKVDGFWFLDGM